MTEAEWLQWRDPAMMLRHLRGKASDRKLRLFACACCRRIWDFLANEWSRKAVEVAEWYADGLATDQELSRAAEGARSAVTMFQIQGDGNTYSAAWESFALAHSAVWATTHRANDPDYPFHAAQAAGGDPYASGEPAVQCDLLRDVFHNPFQPLPSVNPAWLRWNDGAILKLVRAIYDERTFDRLPILADALEEAGCDNADVLTHCRQPGEHVRGCWVIDLLLGKS
jgi:hypothetical protein